MAKNNLLLGNGRALVAPTAWVSSGRKKADVYSMHETRAYLHPQLGRLAEAAAALPDAAVARGEVMGRILVHPEYLAKSYFPTGVLRAADLRHVGTRSKLVQPRRRLKLRGADRPMPTAELLVAGTPASFMQLDQLLMQSDAAGLQRDLSRIEDIAFMRASDRVRQVTVLADGSVLLEAVLHAGADDADIVKAFARWARACDGKADAKRLIVVDGLSFLPVRLPHESVNRLATFSHLRVVRSVSPLRAHDGAMRSKPSLFKSTMPVAGPVSTEFRVAVFDGGMHENALAPFATEHVWPETRRTRTGYLAHGTAVTSALLFGPVSSPGTVLPQPYAAVDHFRIATLHDAKDPEMFDAARRMCEVLDRGQHAFVNISLAPRAAVDDDDVHLWTSVLEKRLASGTVLAVVAVGNDGEDEFPGNRVQVPADLVNALAVGSSTTAAGRTVRAAHSCIGPGRSPGLVKPDGLAWGLDVPLFQADTGDVVMAKGTSFAAPLALRTAVGACALASGISPKVARALLIHTTDRPRGMQAAHVGHGRFTGDSLDLLTCDDHEAMVLYEGFLEPGKAVGAMLPWPRGATPGKVVIRATLVFYTPVDLAHPVNYTRAGIEARLRRSPGGAPVSFFSKAKLYGNSEQELRADAHKWETVVTKQITLEAGGLSDPTLELVYRARDEGHAVAIKSLPPLPYVLVATVSAVEDMQFYNRVRQRHAVLTPVRLRTGVRLQAR